MKKNEKLTILIAIISLLIYVLTNEIIPKIKTNLGSSDNLLLPSNYEDMTEFKINHSQNFAMVTNKNKVVHLLFFTEDSLCLYNQNIENNNIIDAVNKITDILISNNLLMDNSTIEIIKYENITYSEIKSTFIKNITSKNIPIVFTETATTLEKKINSLGLSKEKEEYMITQLDLYSKDIIDKYKDNKKNLEKKECISEQEAQEYANNVYQKLTNYVITNNIVEQERTSAALPIHLIPASLDGNIYPSINSWYYITDKKVYAYIKFDSLNTTYDFCYQGSIDVLKKGEC